MTLVKAATTRPGPLSGPRGFRLVVMLLAAGMSLSLAGCGRGTTERGNRIPLVTTTAVEPAVFAQAIEAIATLEAARSVQLASQATGRVLQLRVRQGQSVRPGQVLLVLDQTQLQAEVASLRAQMQTDRLNHERYERLVRQGAASAIQRDQYRQAAMASRAALVAREADLAFRTVRAPQAGVIGEINLKPGDVLQAGLPFTRLVSNSDQLAEIELPANLSGRVRPGLTVVLQAPDGSGQEISTRISAVEPSVTAATQLLMAQAPLPVAGDQWRNGMRLRARVVLGTRNELAVPFAAVTRLAGQSFVYVIGNRAQLLQRPGQVDRQQLASLPASTRFALQVPVQLGAVQDNRYPVLAGLSSGQQVVTSGLLTLRHGTPVRLRQDRAGNFR
jgi:RND family efflux transporter MFP subunit